MPAKNWLEGVKHVNDPEQQERLTVDRIEIYRGKGVVQPWRWRLVSANNETVTTSEGYFSKWNATRAAKKLFGNKYPIKVTYP